MGQDFAQTSEWAYDGSLPWDLLAYEDHAGTQRLVKDLNAWYRKEPTLAARDHEASGFEWISLSDHENSVLSFLRLGPAATDSFLVVGNFTPVERSGYRVGVPFKGFWREVLNSDAKVYGGQGVGNLGGRATDAVAFDHHPHSLELAIPGLAVVVFRYDG
jgi:1,4-alpha-glucan branching enzyme